MKATPVHMSREHQQKDDLTGLNVLIASHHFYPGSLIGSRRISELSLHLASAGATIKVLTSIPDPIDPSLTIHNPNIRTTRVWAPKPIVDRFLRLFKSTAAPGLSHEKTASQDDHESFDTLEQLKRHYRALEHIIDRNKLWSFFVLVTGSIHRISNRFDIIISSGPPMSIHISAMLLSRFYGCPWIMDMRDPWTDQCGLPWSEKISHWFEQQCLSRADTVVVTSPSAERLIESQLPGIDIKTIMNGHDWTLCHPPTTEKLRILYAGTLYYNRDPLPFLRAFIRLCSSDSVERELVELVFIGDCASWKDTNLKDWAKLHGLEDLFLIRPSVPRSELMALIEDSWVLLIFAQGQPKQIPGKVFEAIGSGRMLFVLTEDDSDTASVVKSSESGVVVPGDDEDAIYRELKKLYDLFLTDRGAFQRREVHEHSRAARNKDYQLLVSNVLNRDQEAGV